MGYSGAPYLSGSGRRSYQYRCNGQLSALRPDPASRCKGKALGGPWIEEQVWADCCRYIDNPSEELADAQRELRERLARSSGLEEQRRTLLAEIATKELERERVLTLFRRGRITTDEAEGHLDEVARETGALRELVESIRAQEALAEAHESQFTDVVSMLNRLRSRAEDIEATNDIAAKREIIDLLVSRISVRTEGQGRRKQAAVTIRHAFRPTSADAVVLDTPPGTPSPPAPRRAPVAPAPPGSGSYPSAG
jgi:site-specific DNA recombinase